MLPLCYASAARVGHVGHLEEEGRIVDVEAGS